MPSVALGRWQGVAASALDQIENAHSAVGGVRRGRRYATLQVNHAYVVMLSSQFQGFCRDLHTEAVAFMASAIPVASLQTVVQTSLTRGRKLDSGNPNPGNLGSDFGGLGMAFWPSVGAANKRSGSRKTKLETLNDWRNAVAHQDWSKVGGPAVQLGTIKGWRAACDGLATTFDAVVCTHLHALVGRRPW